MLGRKLRLALWTARIPRHLSSYNCNFASKEVYDWAIGHNIMHVLVNISSTPCGFPGLLFRVQCSQHLFEVISWYSPSYSRLGKMLHPVLVCCYSALIPKGVSTHWHPATGTGTLKLVQECQAYLSKRKTNRLLPKYLVLSAHWCKLASILHRMGSTSHVILSFLVSNAFVLETPISRECPAPAAP